MAYPDWGVEVKMVDNLPDNVEAEKYCYTEEQGFYENENYTPPDNNSYGITDDLVEQIKDDTIAELIELGVL